MAERRGEARKAADWRKHAFALQQAIEREAWDGDWYRRGYFDDGTPLGSVSSEECRIDSIAQSWAVISGAAERERAVRAMSAVNAQLVSRSDGLVKLFTPPFDHTPHDPGLYQGLSAGTARERRAVHARRGLDRDGFRAAGRWRSRRRDILAAQSHQPCQHPRGHSPLQGRALRGLRRRLFARRHTSAAAAGPGTRARQDGCTAPAIEGILGIHVRGKSLTIDPCIPRAWSGFEITYKHGGSRYRIEVENPHGVSRGIIRATLDGREISGAPCDIALVDDGTYHYVRITLG